MLEGRPELALTSGAACALAAAPAPSKLLLRLLPSSRELLPDTLLLENESGYARLLTLLSIACMPDCC